MKLLDTHAWIWLCSDPTRLSSLALAATTDETLCISIISCWETAMLVQKGRLTFTIEVEQWIEFALQSVILLPITPSIAIASTRLQNFHGDPADRLIIATCLEHSLPIISKDDKIRSTTLVQVIW